MVRSSKGNIYALRIYIIVVDVFPLSLPPGGFPPPPPPNPKYPLLFQIKVKGRYHKKEEIIIKLIQKRTKVFLKFILLYCQFHLSRDSSATKIPQK